MVLESKLDINKFYLLAIKFAAEQKQKTITSIDVNRLETVKNVTNQLGERT